MSDDEQAYPLIATKHEEETLEASPRMAIGSLTSRMRQAVWKSTYRRTRIWAARSVSRETVGRHLSGLMMGRSSSLPRHSLARVSRSSRCPSSSDRRCGRGPLKNCLKTTMFPTFFDICPDGRFVFIQFPQLFPEVDGVDVAVGWTQTLPQLVPK